MKIARIIFPAILTCLLLFTGTGCIWGIDQTVEYRPIEKSTEEPETSTETDKEASTLETTKDASRAQQENGHEASESA